MLAAVGRDLELLAVNPAWSDALGDAARSLTELIHPVDRARVRDGLAAGAGAPMTEIVGRFFQRDGGFRALALRGVHDGEVLHLSARDADGPASELAEVKRRLAAVYETMQELVYTTDDQGVLTGMNRAPAGLTLTDVIGVPMLAFAAADERELMQSRVDAVRERQARIAYETSVVYPDGSRFTYSSRMGPILDAERCVGIMLITQDITAERRAQEATRSFERLLEEKIEALFHANAQLTVQHEQIIAGEQRERARLVRELDFARAIQAGILPRDLRVPGLDIAATMQPCSEMGGDYYDVRRTADGCWLGIGDIAGHGVSAGLVMLMVQSITAALTARDGDATPGEILVQTNRILHDNIRARMGRDEHITMTLLRCHADGRVMFAGAHEDLVVLRARTGVCECVETEGTWLGVVADIAGSTHDRELRLQPGDLLLLYTDGLTEAVGADQEMFGIDRLCAALTAAGGGSAAEVLAGLLASLHAFCGAPTDDVAALVLRYTGDG